MPGGKIDLGEPIIKALQREVMEEVGLEVEVEGLVDVFEHLTPGEENNHFVILYYRCRPLSCAINHNRHEVAEARWVREQELPNYLMPDGTRFILGKIFPGHRRHDDGFAAMIRIIDKKVNLDFPLGHHLHCLIAQIPNRLRKTGHGYIISDPAEKWQQVQTILDLVAAGEGNLKKLHFLLLPETAIPLARFDAMLLCIDRDFRPNSVVMLGMEHIPLRRYREILERFRQDNEEAIELVNRDIAAATCWRCR